MMKQPFTAAYRSLLATGALARRAADAAAAMKACTLCAWQCRVDRRFELGACRTGTQPVVSSYFAHMGEEDPLRGSRGSGTIFFASCNMSCQFCQNYDVSQQRAGTVVSDEELAAIMLDLQARGCHNINFVSPSHVVGPIVRAVHLAAEQGLKLPLVYNTGGYDSMDGLGLLDGIVDIYMPDMKYADAAIALTYSLTPDYPAVNFAAVREMHRQVGDLVMDRQGIAQRGLLVRHLVMPNGLAGTAEIVRFLAEEISKATYINIMGQYRPAWRAGKMPKISRPVTPDEVAEAKRLARKAGLHRLDERKSLRQLFMDE